MDVAIYGDCLESYVTAASLANMGNHVLLCDKAFRHPKLDLENLKENEPALRRMLDQAEQNGALQIVDSIVAAESATIHWFQAREENESELISLIAKVSGMTQGEQAFIVSSCHSIGFFRKVKEKLNTAASTDQSISLVSIPLMLREGVAVNDFEWPSLFLVGVEDEVYTIPAQVKTLIKPYMERAKKSMIVPAETAELIRSSMAVFLALRLAYMNEIAFLCESRGIDIEIVKEALANDPRIGSEYLSPGCGFGGHALVEELNNLQAAFSSNPNALSLLTAINIANNEAKDWVVRKLYTLFDGELSEKHIAIWGGAFKPGVSSILNSPVAHVVEHLHAQGCHLYLYDPLANHEIEIAFKHLEHVTVGNNVYDISENAHAIVLLTAWGQFYNPDFVKLKDSMRRALIVDGRNHLDSEYLQSLGYEYIGFGRKGS